MPRCEEEDVEEQQCGLEGWVDGRGGGVAVRRKKSEERGGGWGRRTARWIWACGGSLRECAHEGESVQWQSEVMVLNVCSYSSSFHLTAIAGDCAVVLLHLESIRVGQNRLSGF